jgi:hypothetical protein
VSRQIHWLLFLSTLAATLTCGYGRTGGELRITLPQGGQDSDGKIMTIGNPNDPDDLGKEMADAHSSGARRIVIRSGIYRFSKCGHPLLDLEHWHKVRISGHGVTLVSSETDPKNDLIRMTECDGVVLDDLTLTQSWQTALQGRVLSVSTSPGGRMDCVWRPDAGYPIPKLGETHLDDGPNIVDSKTRLLKHGCGDEWGAPLNPVGDGTYRVGLPTHCEVEAGDWLVSRGDPAPCKVHLIMSKNCTLSNLVLERNGFAAIFENDGGANSYYDCHWRLGPKPAGAEEKPLVSCSADGFHSVGAFPGPDIENCEFSGVMLDDCIAIHGTLQPVKSSGGEKIVVDQDGMQFKVEQPIRIGTKGYFANGYVKSITLNPDRTATITLDKDYGVPVGAMAGNPLRNGQSFKILNCNLGFTRSRGILVKADEGLIQGNSITECGMSALSAGPEYYWKEGDYVQDLSIRNNQFSKNGFAGRQAAAVLIHGEGAKGNRNVTIESNTFDSNYSGDIDIEWTAIATISGNEFSAPLSFPPGFSQPRSIAINSSSDVQLKRNQFKNPNNYQIPIVFAGTDVQRLSQDSGR